MARQIARINKAQSFLRTDFGGSDQLSRLGVRWVGHFVILVERGDVPGNVPADRSQEFRDGAQFFLAVVEPGHDQRDDFKPQAAFGDQVNRFCDVGERAAELPVMFLLETFQIHFVSHNPGAQKVQRFGRGVAVGDESAEQTGGLGLLKHGDGPFGGDQRLVIARHDKACFQFARGRDELFRRDCLEGRDRRFVAQCLAGDPVLTVGTMEIASHHSEGERVTAGVHVEKRLLLDRVALQRRDVAERNPQLRALIETHFANAASAFADQTAMAAGGATDTVAFGFPECANRRVAVQPGGERLVCDARF